MMNILQFFRSSTYWQFAIGAWLLSFLVLPGSQSQNLFTYVAILLPVLATFRLVELKEFFSDPLSLGLLLVILALFSTSFIDGDPSSIAKFGTMVLLFYLGIIRVPSYSNETAYKIAWILLLIIIVYVIGNMVWKYQQGIWQPGVRLVELIGKLENPIYVTNIMGCMLAIITLTGIQLRKIQYVIIAYILTLFLALAVLQTRSILPMTIIMGIITYFALRSHTSMTNRITKLVLVTFASLLALLIAYALLHTTIGESLLTRKFYRIEIWQGFIGETMRCGMWLGCGPEHKFHYISHDGQTMVNPHSIFFTQFYKAGVIGLIPLLTISIWALVYSFRQKYWAGWFFMAALIGLSIDGSSLIHSPNMRWLMFHLPLALLIAKRLQDKRTIPDSPNSASPFPAPLP